MAIGKYQVFEARNDEFYFNLYATNGKCICHSELYKSIAGVLSGIDSVRRNCTDLKNYEVRRDQNNAPYFVLHAKNGEIIFMSESYSDLTKCNKGIQSVMRNGVSEIMDMERAVTEKIENTKTDKTGNKTIGVTGNPFINKVRQFFGSKVGRNDACGCGSGLKFKKCCINKIAAE